MRADRQPHNVKVLVEEAVYEAAPDLTSLVVEGLEEPCRIRIRCVERLCWVLCLLQAWRQPACAKAAKVWIECCYSDMRVSEAVMSISSAEHDDASFRDAAPVCAKAATKGGALRFVQRRSALRASAPARTAAAAGCFVPAMPARLLFSGRAMRSSNSSLATLAGSG